MELSTEMERYITQSMGITINWLRRVCRPPMYSLLTDDTLDFSVRVLLLFSSFCVCLKYYFSLPPLMFSNFVTLFNSHSRICLLCLFVCVLFVLFVCLLSVCSSRQVVPYSNAHLLRTS